MPTIITKKVIEQIDAMAGDDPEQIMADTIKGPGI